MASTAPKKQREPRTVPTITELAAWSGFSRQTVHSWSKAADFPSAANGEFSPFDVGSWHALKGLQTSDIENADLESRMMERVREERWMILKLDRQEREGTLVKREFVREVFALVSSQLRLLGERVNLNPQNSPALLEECLHTIEHLGQQWIDANSGEEASE